MNDFEYFQKEWAKQNDKLGIKQVNISDVYNEITLHRRGEYLIPIKTPLRSLDHSFNFGRGRLTLWTGYPQCFDGDQLIHTEKGVKRIDEIDLSDKVLSYNHQSCQTEYKRVLRVIKNAPKKRMIKIKMKDGSVIKVTEDHAFFNGHSYLKIKDILISFEK